MILIAYDGSDDAKAAIVEAGRLFPGDAATVVCAWQHFLDTMARAGAGIGMVVDYDTIDHETEQQATARAEEGADLARQAGLGETTAAALGVTTTLADTILAEARRRHARVIVVGSRGLGSVKAFLLGSVSGALLHHADRPVLVIPSPEVAAHRAAHLT
ncbi:universal stress protein [Conexibacter sp. DBS9H8]|uniref:universal stress protein n=1 Tax=Conexibacter sp. DBS9H8 TaxID=2937801 RepID=UPI00200D9256|nr:universal stress protein [Conexibacter sp. DBS9H8]